MTESSSPAQGRPEDVVIIVSASAHSGLRFISELIRQAGRSPRWLAGERTADSRLDRSVTLFDDTAATPDLADPVALAEAAERLAGGRPAALLCWDDDTMIATAQAARRLGLPGPPPDALQRCRHKYAARRALRAAGLTSPGFGLLSCAEDADQVAAEVGMPAVIKPINGSGSHLVRRVTDAGQLATAYRELARAAGGGPTAHGGSYARPITDPDTGQQLRPDRCFLVEGMLSGSEYSVEVVVRDGAVEQVLLLDKFLVDGDYFERGFCWPPLDLPDDRAALLSRAVDGAVTALGIDNTTAHVEVLDDPVLGPTIVEVNAGRPGGQIIGLLADVGVGVDLRAEHLALTLGEPAPRRAGPKLPPPLATLTLYPDRPGTILRLDGLDAVEQHPDVITMVQAAYPGDRLDTDHETFPVNVLVAGLETRQDLLSTYRELDDALDFVMTDQP